jgi:hypothetical protein
MKYIPDATAFAKLNPGSDREKQDEIVTRLSRVEREVAGLHADFAGLSLRLNNLDRRVGRIERRLDLIEEEA